MTLIVKQRKFYRIFQIFFKQRQIHFLQLCLLREGVGGHTADVVVIEQQYLHALGDVERAHVGDLVVAGVDVLKGGAVIDPEVILMRLNSIAVNV